MNTVTNDNAVSFSNEIWQADVLGQIYETNLEELTQWITEGALMPDDKVRRGNLRWLDAGKVPPLMPFFNAKANGLEPPQIQISTANAGNFSAQTENFQSAADFSNNSAYENQNGNGNSAFHPGNSTHRQENLQHPEQSVCVMHPEEEAKYFCETCGNSFCKLCPNSYGGSVKICPMCGAMCQSIAETKVKRQKEFKYHHDISEGFGFSDFGNAIAHPFKHKTSLFVGAIMFMFFTLGQSAGAIGGMFMIGAAIFCFMLANMLTFGVLANTIDNFTQGKVEANFMPNFDDFSLWDDVVHPFFLSIGAYLSSFGPLILIIAVVVYWMISSLASQMKPIQENAAEMTYLQQNNEHKVVEQSEQVKRLLENVKKNNPNKFNNESLNLNETEMPAMDETEEQVRQAEALIQQTRKDQLESAIGKSPETMQKENAQMLKSFFTMGVPVMFLLLLAFLWGIFYFPAACAVAGYTRSFMATINPAVGLDTIKRLGLDYAKIWLMALLLGIFSGIVSVILAVVLSPFDMPRMGNLPATAIGSLFTFYFSVVFSCVLGYALYKSSDRLNLYKG